MKIFLLDKDPAKIVEKLCDSHLASLPGHYIRVLYTVYKKNVESNYFLDTCFNAIEKETPLVKWVGSCYNNYIWLSLLVGKMHEEYALRFGSPPQKSTVAAGVLLQNIHLLESKLPTDIWSIPPGCESIEIELRNYRKRYKNKKRTKKQIIIHDA